MSDSFPPRDANFEITEDGWCAFAARDPSPNFNARPEGEKLDLVVIHCISLPEGRFGGPQVADFFCNRLDLSSDPSFESLRGVNVSAHFFLRRDGQLVQFVSCNDRAWHAGQSAFNGRSDCNNFSIGIEIEGVVKGERFEVIQYTTLGTLIAALQRRYPIKHVRGHEHVAPGRKNDPGRCFDWTYCVEFTRVAQMCAPGVDEDGYAERLDIFGDTFR